MNATDSTRPSRTRATLLNGLIALAFLGAQGICARDVGTEQAPGFVSDQAARDAAPPASASSSTRGFKARLQHLSDGDSFTVVNESGQKTKIRLSGIDAPESTQAFGDLARQRLRQLLEGAVLTVQPIKRDPFGRTVAKVLVHDRDPALEMIEAGLAWHYRRYEMDQSARDRRLYARAEAQARESRVGLWSLDSPQPPWRYRQEQRGR